MDNAELLTLGVVIALVAIGIFVAGIGRSRPREGPEAFAPRPATAERKPFPEGKACPGCSVGDAYVLTSGTTLTVYACTKRCGWEQTR